MNLRGTRTAGRQRRVPRGLIELHLGEKRYVSYHGVAEEIYVVLRGSGSVEVDDERFEVRALDAGLVAPGSARELQARPDGLEVLAFGSHTPGDGEMVAGR